MSTLSLSGFRIPRTVLTAALTLVSVVAIAGGAQASSGSGSQQAQSSCSYPEAEQVFARFGDDGYYQLAPDGGLEAGGTGWTFTNGAEVIEGNESHFLNASTDQAALSIPYGATATSPRVCVDATTPSFRLMALNAGDRDAKLRVTVTYELAKGTKTRVTDVRSESRWSPTEALQLDTDGEVERVARISFTPRDSAGSWLLDDLYIDPFARR